MKRPRGWIYESDLPHSPRADAVRADILDRLRQHHGEDTLPRGGRGLFYDLRPHGIPGNERGIIYTKHPKAKGKGNANMEADAKYVQEQLGLMRRVFNPETGEWLIDEDWIADSRTPDPYQPPEVADANDAAKNVRAYLDTLHLSRQRGQPVYLELRCEAADLRQRIARIARPYGVTVYSGGGFDAIKPKKEAAERAACRSVPTLIGHIVDFDTYGDRIGTSFAEDVESWFNWHKQFNCTTESLTVERLALTEPQANEHDLLDADGKAEVDGLPVPVLDEIVCTFIETHLDADIQWRVVKREAAMRKAVWRLLARQHPVGGRGRIKRGADWSWARGGDWR
jgi:hypothetical protein